MKSSISLAIALLLSFASFSQTINQIPLDSINSPFLQLACIGPEFSNLKEKDNYLILKLDLGSWNDSLVSDVPIKLRDINGKLIKTKTDVEVLNFFYKYGYELVSVNRMGFIFEDSRTYLLKKSIPRSSVKLSYSTMSDSVLKANIIKAEIQAAEARKELEEYLRRQKKN